MYPTHAHIINFMTSELKYNMLSTIIWNKNNTSSRTTWGSWLSPSSPSFPTPFEYILIFYNEVKKKQIKGKTDLTKKEFIDNSLALWQFAGEKKKNTNHPAAFPIELPYRCIKQLTWIGDTVLDIFAGAGTTGVAAKQLNRKYILIEKSLDYINLIKKRLEDTQISIF
jgi:site-specific DNA-methyltransferase (adenine-specific)